MTGRSLALPLARFHVRPAAARAAFLSLLALVVVVVGVRYYAKASKPRPDGEQTRTAYLRWRPQVLELAAGTDIYRAHQYPNPPVMALILTPLMHLPPMAGAMLWFGLKAGMAGCVAVWAFRLLGATSPLPDWAKAAAILFALHPVLGDLSHGNVNLFIGFLTVGALELYRRRLDTAAGLTLALAVACKVTPALFLPYFAWKRGWRVLAGATAGLALWLVVVPGAALGWDHNLTLLTSWFDGMVRPFVIDGKVTSEHPNQSIPGLAFRLLTREPSFLAYDEADGHPVPTGFHTLIDLGPAAARLVVKGAMGLFAVAVVLLCRYPTWRRDVSRGGPTFAAECGLILLGMLLFSERTWKHHAVTLVVPFAVLLWAAAGGVTGRTRRLVIGATGAAVLLGLVPSLLAPEAQDLSLVYGTYTAAWGLMAAAVCGVLVSLRTGWPPATPSSPRPPVAAPPACPAGCPEGGGTVPAAVPAHRPSPLR